MQNILSELAAAGGTIEFSEAALPFAEEEVNRAIDAGYIVHVLEGGATGTTESLGLTDEGRLLMGLPERFSVRKWLWRLVTAKARAV